MVEVAATFDRLRKAKAKLAAVLPTIKPHGVGRTADVDACIAAYNALRRMKLPKHLCDRIAVIGWNIPPTPWAKARGVAVRSLGPYQRIGPGLRRTRKLTPIPTAYLPDKSNTKEK